MESITFTPADYQDLKKMFIESQNIIRDQAKKLANAKIVWVDTKEAAEITRYNEKTLKLNKDEIGYRTKGRDIFFKLSDLEEWMNRYYRGPKK